MLAFTIKNFHSCNLDLHICYLPDFSALSNLHLYLRRDNSKWKSNHGNTKKKISPWKLKSQVIVSMWKHLHRCLIDGGNVHYLHNVFSISFADWWKPIPFLSTLQFLNLSQISIFSLILKWRKVANSLYYLFKKI